MYLIFIMSLEINFIAGSFHFNTQLAETVEKKRTDEKKRKMLSEDADGEENSGNKKRKHRSRSNSDEEQPGPSFQLTPGQRKKICHPDFHCYRVDYHSVNCKLQNTDFSKVQEHLLLYISSLMCKPSKNSSWFIHSSVIFWKQYISGMHVKSHTAKTNVSVPMQNKYWGIFRAASLGFV